MFILVFALFLAVMRSLPGPVFFPSRVLATAYTDVFRGIPTILVVYLLGFGIPGLQLHGVPNSQFFWAAVALVLVYSAYVAEVYRAGIESMHPSQSAAARSLGLSHAQSMRYVVLPQAVRRVIPPLLNDFIGLQKDTALVALLGVVEAFRQSQIESAADFNYTPYLATALLFLLLTIPLDALHRLADRARPPPRSSRAHERARARGRPQVVRRERGAARHRPRGGRARGGLPDRRLGLGQVDAAALREPARADRRRPHLPRRRRDHRRGVDVNRVRREIGIVFQSYNLFPHMTRARERHPRPAQGARALARDAEQRADELLARFGLEDKRGDYPDSLSGGQQQRVAIVRALALRPKLMLLDEITSALDPELVAEVLNVVRELAQGGMTMLIATHEMVFARDIADRVCFLDEGVILEEGPPAQIFSAPREPRTQQFLARIVEAGRL